MGVGGAPGPGSDRNGQSGTGSAEWNARNPAPIASAASAGRASHRGLTAFSPASASVSNPSPSPSSLGASTGGTGVKAPAQRSRAACAGRSAVPDGAHLTNRRGLPGPLGPPPSSKVNPPSSLRHTGRTGAPPASRDTTAGTSTSGWGGPASSTTTSFGEFALRETRLR
ncbi:MAG TPA: hypothetical protein VGM60_24325 [Pseudonocardia sp.]